MKRVRTRCPAKVNLSLRVFPPDGSGYHPVETELQAVDLCDDLEVTISSQTQIECVDFELPSNNTLEKTLRLLSESCDLPPLSVELRKRIPAEAGLGGGSSNAAGLLRCLMILGVRGLSSELASEVAAAVGKDAPFFLVGGRAIGTGYGDTMMPLPDIDPIWICLCKPNAGASTMAAYERLDRVRAGSAAWQTSERQPANDFELVASPESLALIRALKNHSARAPMLSGSGSAVFGRFEHADAAQHAAKVISAEFGCWAHACKTLSRQESLWTS